MRAQILARYLAAYLPDEPIEPVTWRSGWTPGGQRAPWPEAGRHDDVADAVVRGVLGLA